MYARTLWPRHDNSLYQRADAIGFAIRGCYSTTTVAGFFDSRKVAAAHFGVCRPNEELQSSARSGAYYVKRSRDHESSCSGV